MIPQRIISTEESGRENSFYLNEQDIDEINQLTAGGWVANNMGRKYQRVLLLFKVLYTYMEKHKDRSIMLEWNHRDNKPRLYTMKRTDTALDKNVFRALGTGEIAADLGSLEYVKVNDKGFDQQSVFFVFSQIHSSIPKWAYTIINNALTNEKGKKKNYQANFEDCEFLLSLKLPTFIFFFQEGSFKFELTTPNYFMRESDSNRCVLALVPDELLSSVWMIGAAFAKTHKIELRSSPEDRTSKQYRISSYAKANA
ncbi:unnamed protein product [Albugo candida]|uniref:Uncharacterized protein n=1 Tax=Albugo candida TaxID=65357 RepID=A0A024FV27_9STRA|nr:unnamed protein product [Albugo candida]|eukprot:CCI10484.1 unnamed protein product [Albugo candida]